jgi:hypothetical protein
MDEKERIYIELSPWWRRSGIIVFLVTYGGALCAQFDDVARI